jgi:AcrR family transcriptional regulator
MTKKEELLRKISSLFAEKGYDKTSIRDIAAHLGMTNAGLYYHFKNKQQMLVDIMNQGMDNALTRMERELPLIGTAEERIAWIIRSQIDFYAKNKSQTKASIHERAALEPKYARIMDRKEKKYVEFVKQAVSGIIREHPSITISQEVAAYSLLGMLNWLVHWYDPEGTVPPDELASSIFAIFLNGLKGEATSHRGTSSGETGIRRKF